MERPRKRARVAAPQDDNFDVASSRHVNDMRLKSSLECIFAKYSADFTDIGDVIDLETGTIVEDNGHVACMRDERDTGPSQAQRFLRALSLGRDGGDEHQIHANPSEDFDEQEDKANRKDDGEAIGRFGSRTQRMTPDSRAPSTLDAGPAQQRLFGAAMLQELSQNIASLFAPYLARFTGPSQAIEPAWRTPNIGAAVPKPVHGTPLRSPAIRASVTSPKTESLWALPERRNSAGHAQTTPGQLQYHGRILGEASDIDELSPDVSMNGHGTTQSSKYVRRERRSFPPFSHEEDKRLIEMRGHHDSEQLVWTDIYKRFPDRPSWSLRYRYHKHLKNRVESSPIPPKTSSPLRSHTEQVIAEDSLPSPVSLEFETGDRHTVTSHAETPRHTAHTSQHRERKLDMAVPERFPRILRSSSCVGKASAPVRDSVRNIEARMREEEGAPQGIHSMIPSREPLHDGSGQPQRAEASRPSTRSGKNATMAHSPRTSHSSAYDNKKLNKWLSRAEDTVQRTGLKGNGSGSICQVVIPARHNIDNNVTEHSPCVSHPQESISSTNDKKPSPLSKVPVAPVALATRARAGESPKSTPQRSTPSKHIKTYSATKKLPETANLSRRRRTQMVSNSDSEDELAL